MGAKQWSGSRVAYLLGCSCALVLLGLSAIQPLAFAVVRMTYRHPIDFAYNEGWNVINTARFLNGENLYVPLDRFPLTPVNYPPASFLIVGAVSHWTPTPLLAGRAVALVSLLVIAGLIYGAVTASTGRRLAGVVGALVWVGTMTSDWGLLYVGFDDPQLLAHAISLCAFYLYVRWRPRIDLRRACVLGFLVSLAVFTKHIAIVVPLTIAADLLIDNRRDGLRFVTVASVIGLVMLSATFAYGGTNFAMNFLDVLRPMTPELRWFWFRDLFIHNAMAGVFVPAAVLALARDQRFRPFLIYFAVSFALAYYLQGGHAQGRNVWFEFVIAAACAYGLFAAGPPTITLPTVRSLGVIAIVAALGANEFVLSRLSADGILEAPTRLMIRFAQCGGLLVGFRLMARTTATRRLTGALLFGFVLSASALAPLKSVAIWSTAPQLEQLRRNEETYELDVALLKSIPGPALFESMLLGFDAGKEFLYDPFNTAVMMAAGRIPEGLLVDRIRARDFSVVVLNYDLDDMVAALAPVTDGKPAISGSDRWTDHTLLALKQNYRKLSQDRLRRAFFYVPAAAD